MRYLYCTVPTRTQLCIVTIIAMCIESVNVSVHSRAEEPRALLSAPVNLLATLKISPVLMLLLHHSETNIRSCIQWNCYRKASCELTYWLSPGNQDHGACSPGAVWEAPHPSLQKTGNSHLHLFCLRVEAELTAFTNLSEVFTFLCFC